MSDLQERMRRVLQRNKPTAARTQSAETPPPVRPQTHSRRWQDFRGRTVTVINFGSKTVIYQRDGYDQYSEIGREQFLREFVEVRP